MSLITVDAANAEFYAAFEAVDLDRMSAVWADGPYAESVSCVHPGWPLLRGRGEVLRSWALIMANTPFIQFVLTDLRTEIRDEYAVVTCSENILTADDDTDVGFAAGGSVVTTNMFVRTEGQWRLWLHHGSPVLNRIGDGEE
ncbi:nuclear transport factor 2 family protein [Actinomadura sp. HBU206391]|uniref:nuclear transport factor 2 family protein n=1 Tax=Actinomadura sp. HBU206391 TaxID=2731692 RepID=UPI00164F03E9|nr:nuclear transport factor 2 family protein [Actinomadura sp. HBU206391]MBC6458861.1 nuclear transport factor 2 family protein [Actinomadura sp. HBU206391]